MLTVDVGILEGQTEPLRVLPLTPDHGSFKLLAAPPVGRRVRPSPAGRAHSSDPQRGGGWSPFWASEAQLLTQKAT